MNYLALLVGTYLALSGNRDFNGDTSQLWADFKAEHGKVYENSHVESMRRIIFEHNLARISRHQRNLTSLAQNTEEPPFSIGLNHLADLSDVEYAAMNGFKLPSYYKNGLHNEPDSDKFIQSILEDDSIEVPDEVDWRKIPGRVSEVKNQGQCGSCWAFASTGVLEGQEKVRLDSVRSNSSDLIELSEQNLVDCVTKDYGCKGGFMADALDFVKQEGGIDDEKSYPYEERQRKCRYTKSHSVMTDKGSAILPVGDEEKLKSVVAKFGPVAVAIDASSFWFMFYRRGVFHTRFCHNKEDQLDHGVLVVGYGTDAKHGDYWIVKNSWGARWGEKGYIRMARNKNNMCGIATVATIPTF